MVALRAEGASSVAPAMRNSLLCPLADCMPATDHVDDEQIANIGGRKSEKSF
jgi:hypothetical protein